MTDVALAQFCLPDPSNHHKKTTSLLQIEIQNLNSVAGIGAVVLIKPTEEELLISTNKEHRDSIHTLDRGGTQRPGRPSVLLQRPHLSSTSFSIGRLCFYSILSSVADCSSGGREDCLKGGIECGRGLLKSSVIGECTKLAYRKAGPAYKVKTCNHERCTNL